MNKVLAPRVPGIARMLGAGQLLAAVAGFVVLGGLLLSYQFVTLRQGLQADLEIHAKVLGENISAPLMFGDREDANNVLHAFLADPVLIEAVVYDEAGLEFSAFRRSPAPSGTLAWLVPGWQGTATVKRSIVHRDRTLGSVLLRADTGAIATALRNHATLFGLSSLGALLASTLLSRSSRQRVARAESELAYLAYTDPVTSLPNRRRGQEELEAALQHARAHGERVGLMLIDLDNFKLINDSAGHAAGDQLLRQVSARLRAAARDSDLVCRFGGDEFIVIAGQLASHAQLADIAAAFKERLRRPVQLDSMEATVTASIGTCLFPDDAASAEEFMRNADAALYHAKESGRNRISAFQPAMMHSTQRRAQLERDLQRALNAGELAVFYQPQFDCANRQIIGVEALLRWMHPEHGFVPPDEFIPIAEESGLIVEIGEWVLERACADIVDLRRKTAYPLHVAVNVSARQFRECDFASNVERILERTGLPPASLELELTESMVMQDRGAAVAFMHAMRAMGVRLSMDDFGTGYSSLSYLQSFPINSLKVDRSFVRPLPDAGQRLVSAVIGLAHDFGLTVVAEGVEDGAQLEWLRQAGCEYAQGYLLGRPMAVSALQSRLFEQSRSAA